MADMKELAAELRRAEAAPQADFWLASMQDRGVKDIDFDR